MTAAAEPVDAVPAADLLAAQPPVLERAGALAEIRERIEARDGRLLVIDDDPTGTQSVHGVPVLTAWSEQDLAAALRDAGTVFVLTNSRSMPEREAVAVSAQITERAAAIAADEGFELAVASRSDSTMRGHFPHEPDAVAGALEAAGQAVGGLLLCPCFLEAGRFTVDDVQWVAQDDQLVPSARTTYASDRSFGYSASNLRRWIEEKTRGGARGRRAQPRPGGHPRRRPRARARDPGRGRGSPARGGQRDGVRRPRGGGARAARRRGGRAGLRLSLRPVVRARARRHRAGAAALRRRALCPARARRPRARARRLARGDDDAPAREAALALDGVHARELSVARLLDPATREQEIAAALGEIERHLPEREVILYTSRELARAEGSDQALDVGRSVSDALVELVRRLDPGLPLAFCVAKGGITSSDIGTRGFGVRRAEVAGQMLPGTISVWILPEDSAFPGLPYVIFPGNVGEPGTLAEVIERLAA